MNARAGVRRANTKRESLFRLISAITVESRRSGLRLRGGNMFSVQGLIPRGDCLGFLFTFRFVNPGLGGERGSVVQWKHRRRARWAYFIQTHAADHSKLPPKKYHETERKHFSE